MIQLFLKGRHKYLDVCNLSQPFFDLSKRTKIINNDKGFLFKQILRFVENIKRDIARLDNKYENHKDLCKEVWKDKDQIIFLSIDLRRKVKVNIVFLEKAKTFLLNVFHKQILSEVI